MSSKNRRHPRVAIIGAGLSGLALAVNLQSVGISDFVLFDRESGPGGTWWRNRYPGCEVDVPSVVYSFTFFPYSWSRTHAGQPELQRYVEDVVKEYDLSSRLRFNTEVRSAVWNEATGRYAVELGSGEIEQFDVVVSAVGLFSEPNIPAWVADFGGRVVHTIDWNDEVDLAGKTVAVVGTGSTSCQLVPELAKVVGQLNVYQREPGYVLPKRAHNLSPAERVKYDRTRWTGRIARYRLFHETNRGMKAFDPDSPEQAKVVSYFKHYLEKTVTDPEVRAQLTPSYPYGCKRPIFADDYYASFNRPNVTLVPHAVVSATSDGLVDSRGAKTETDVLVLATGFRTTDYLASIEVVGVGGQRLHDRWKGDPEAFLGVTVPGFPNFFMLYGPNTNGGWSILSQLERQAELVARALRRVEPRVSVQDTSGRVADRYGRWIQAAIANRRPVLQAGCHNYYYTASGKNVTQWPFSPVIYWALTRFMPALGLRRRRLAKSKERI